MRYITVDELAEIIRSDKKPMKDYLVVDVRDDDYRGGNVKGSLNIPSLKFQQKLEDLLEQTKEIPMLIFHCALSQQRGPMTARLYAEARLLQSVDSVEHEVLILRGGFTDFQDKFKDDPELVENWSKRAWALEYLDVRYLSERSNSPSE